jgi:hypothetical protein
MRKTQLNRGTKKLQARKELKAGTKKLTSSARLERTAAIAPVSARRRKENAERRAMATKLWPGGQPPCHRRGCTRLADDLHEPLTRARGGSITDPANAVPLCRTCHEEITFTPESELGWAYAEGLLVHSWAGRSTKS